MNWQRRKGQVWLMNHSTLVMSMKEWMQIMFVQNSVPEQLTKVLRENIRKWKKWNNCYVYQNEDQELWWKITVFFEPSFCRK